MRNIALLLWFCLVLLLCVLPARADDFDSLRLKWRGILTGTGYDLKEEKVRARLAGIEGDARRAWASMNKEDGRTCLWKDLNHDKASADITATYGRLNGMALAFATPGTSLHGDRALAADIIAALDWMNVHRYNPEIPQYMNWWDWTIGVPRQLTDVAVLMYDQLSPAQLKNYMAAIEKHSPWPCPKESRNTGANLIWMAQVTGIRGCLMKDPALVAGCRDSFSKVFPYVTQGDGFYADGSFIQHRNLPYTLGYGSALISTMAPLLQWLANSPWAITDPAQANLYRWIFDSFEPAIYRGHKFNGLRGREPGRISGNSNEAGSLLDAFLQIAQFAPPAESLRIKQMVKEWILSDTSCPDFVAKRPLATMELARQLLDDPKIPRRGELLGHYTFASMDRVIHLGSGYGLCISMCSSRIANFESINGENLAGWFTGDGQLQLYNADLEAFSDHYAPTIDPCRLPGVTADITHNKLPHTPVRTGPHAQGQGTLSPHSWVGGATLDRFGAAGIQFKGAGVTLTGKKSWFMFDNEIVCLGAGITSTDHRPIETTVDNRKLSDKRPVAFVVNGKPTPPKPGWEETIAGVQWAYLEGNVPGAEIGYYFPQAPTLKIARQTRSGSWQEIHAKGPAERYQRTFLRIGFEHGSDPKVAGYEYFLLPCMNPEQTRKYAQAPEVTILANNEAVQAVRENTLGITAANFWGETGGTIGLITADKPSCVLVREEKEGISVAVSDPTQLNADCIDLQIALPAGKVLQTGSAGASSSQGDSNVVVSQTSPFIRMKVKVGNSLGRTYTARFAR